MRDHLKWSHSKSANPRHLQGNKDSAVAGEEMGSQQAQGRESGELFMSPSVMTEHLLSLEMHHSLLKHLPPPQTTRERA